MGSPNTHTWGSPSPATPLRALNAGGPITPGSALGNGGLDQHGECEGEGWGWVEEVGEW